jgi:MEMO1 family protein
MQAAMATMAIPGMSRPPAVAGLFYSDERNELTAEVGAFLANVPISRVKLPKAIIVPHAGYIYSGPIAASAYALLNGARGRIKRVVVLGPAHRVAVRGLALPGAEAFLTPLGSVPLDLDALTSLRKLPQVVESRAAHAQEHSLEVQLPFLQALLDDFSLVPLVVGDADADQVAEVLELLWGGDETLIVISSDLSHYLPYDTARRIDQETAQAIIALEDGIDYHQACGAMPINGLIEAVRRHDLQPALLDLRNSGDTAGDKSRVVGYGAFAFHGPAAS